MKITGWILTVFGGLSLIGGTLGAGNGRPPHFGGLVFLVIGLYCLHVAKRRKKEEEEKKRWTSKNSTEETTNDPT